MSGFAFRVASWAMPCDAPSALPGSGRGGWAAVGQVLGPHAAAGGQRTFVSRHTPESGRAARLPVMPVLPLSTSSARPGS